MEGQSLRDQKWDGVGSESRRAENGNAPRGQSVFGEDDRSCSKTEEARHACSFEHVRCIREDGVNGECGGIEKGHDRQGLKAG